MEDTDMTKGKIDKAKHNVKHAVADLKENTGNMMSGVKADIRKARAEVANTVDDVMADVTATVSKLKAAAREDGMVQQASEIRADINAGVEKANSNMRRNLAYARADAARLNARAKRRIANPK
jgi:hypothetical protein